MIGSLNLPWKMIRKLHRVSASAKDSAEQTGERSFFPAGSIGEMDKKYSRIFVAYHVLAQLGFTEERITQCISEGLKEGDGWEEALDWVSRSVHHLLISRCGFTWMRTSA